MQSVTLVFHIHQPFVIRNYSVFDRDEQYFDSYQTRTLIRNYATDCVLPTHRILLALLGKFRGRFRFNCAVSGTALDLFEQYAPEVLESLVELARTGCVEFLGVPYHHGLGFLYAPDDFQEQIRLHGQRIEGLTGAAPRVFCNTELIHNDELAGTIADCGFHAAICDGWAECLDGRNGDHVYTGAKQLSLLLRNPKLSRAISQGFSDPDWLGWPITAPAYARAVLEAAGAGEVVNLFWPMATFGRTFGADTGIFEFLRHFPGQILAGGDVEFVTCSQAVQWNSSAGPFCPDRFISTTERGGHLSDWLGNPLQSHSIHRLYEFSSGSFTSAELKEDWRRLHSCEHFEAMNTGRKSVYACYVDSPYDAYIRFMNVCDSIASRLSRHVSH